jgi:hypothetical protein
MAQPPGPAGRQVQLHPSSETTFFLMPGNIRIEFVKDEKGLVTHLTLGGAQGINTTKAVRR